jgi:hypothetical protein
MARVEVTVSLDPLEVLSKMDPISQRKAIFVLLGKFLKEEDLSDAQMELVRSLVSLINERSDNRFTPPLNGITPETATLLGLE